MRAYYLLHFWKDVKFMLIHDHCHILANIAENLCTWTKNDTVYGIQINFLRTCLY